MDRKGSSWNHTLYIHTSRYYFTSVWNSLVISEWKVFLYHFFFFFQCILIFKSVEYYNQANQSKITANIKLIQYNLPYLHLSVWNAESESWNTIANKNLSLLWFIQIWSDRFSSHQLQLHYHWDFTDPRAAVDNMRLYSARSQFLLWDILYTQYLPAVMIRLQKHLKPNKQTLETDVSRVQTVVRDFCTVFL